MAYRVRSPIQVSIFSGRFQAMCVHAGMMMSRSSWSDKGDEHLVDEETDGQTLGFSFVTRFRIFSSRKSRPGSPRFPLAYRFGSFSAT
jgi:hypothetical protein